MNQVILFLILGVSTTLSQHRGKTIEYQHNHLHHPFHFGHGSTKNETLESNKCNNNITCCFDGFWWLAFIKMLNKEEKQLTCKFLHTHWPSSQFHWPCGNDSGYVPLNKVIMKIQTPATSQMEEQISSLNRKRTKPRTTLREQMF